MCYHLWDPTGAPCRSGKNVGCLVTQRHWWPGENQGLKTGLNWGFGQSDGARHLVRRNSLRQIVITFFADKRPQYFSRSMIALGYFFGPLPESQTDSWLLAPTSSKLLCMWWNPMFSSGPWVGVNNPCLCVITCPLFCLDCSFWLQFSLCPPGGLA